LRHTPLQNVPKAGKIDAQFFFASHDAELKLLYSEAHPPEGDHPPPRTSCFCRLSKSIQDWVSMNCSELANRITDLQPDANDRDIARLSLLLQNAVDDIDEFENEERLLTVWREISWRLQAATDQHAAMTDELENLAQSDPQKFSPDQIWILIRAIKVQSQILRLYVGDQFCGVE
jgi:hypothetical protein